MCRFFAALALTLTITPALRAQDPKRPGTTAVRIFDGWPPRTTANPDTRSWSRDSAGVVEVIGLELRRWAPTDTTVQVTNLQVYGDSATGVGRWAQSRDGYSAGRFVLDRKKARWTLRPWTPSDTVTLAVFRTPDL